LIEPAIVRHSTLSLADPRSGSQVPKPPPRLGTMVPGACRSRCKQGAVSTDDDAEATVKTTDVGAQVVSGYGGGRRGPGCGYHTPGAGCVPRGRMRAVMTGFQAGYRGRIRSTVSGEILSGCGNRPLTRLTAGREGWCGACPDPKGRLRIPARHSPPDAKSRLPRTGLPLLSGPISESRRRPFRRFCCARLRPTGLCFAGWHVPPLGS